MKRGLSIILSLMLALLCGACQGGAREAAYTAPGLEQKRASWQEKTEPVSLSTNYFYSSGGSGEKRAAWGEDAVSRAIMDLTGSGWPCPMATSPWINAGRPATCRIWYTWRAPKRPSR